MRYLAIVLALFVSFSSFAKIVNPERERVQQFVQSAVDYAKKNGKEKALIEFRKPKGLFRQGDQYLFAYSYDGICLADISLPADKIGKSALDIKDVNGTPMIRVMSTRAKESELRALTDHKNPEGSWVYYFFNNPKTGVDAPKSTFVMPVADMDFWIGSGYYFPLPTMPTGNNKK